MTLKEIRKRFHKTQEQLGLRADRSQPWVSEVENAEDATVYNLALWAAALGLSLTLEIRDPRRNESLAFRHFTPDDLEELSRLARKHEGQHDQ